MMSNLCYGFYWLYDKLIGDFFFFGFIYLLILFLEKNYGIIIIFF